MTRIADEMVAECCKAGYAAAPALGRYATRQPAVDAFTRAVLEEYIRQLSDAMEGVTGFTEIRDSALDLMLERHRTAQEAEKKQLVFAGIDPGSPDGDKDGMVLMTMTAEGPRVVGITDDPALIHDFIEKAGQ